MNVCSEQTNLNPTKSGIINSGKIRLGVNIDHVATLRKLRDTPYPNILHAAKLCIEGGADQITVHLREDRRHIVDQDVELLRKKILVDLNLEMAATEEMLSIALRIKPHSICIVPEKREERTTEGGLDLSDERRNTFLKEIARKAYETGILTSFFIEPSPDDVARAKELGAQAIELHTGALCIAYQTKDIQKLEQQWQNLEQAVQEGKKQELLVHAGHGIDYEIAAELSKRISGIQEYNIGHAIVCESVFCGLKEATQKMKEALK